jgi:hypothetical protein
MNQPQPNGRKKPPLLGLRGSAIQLLKPEIVVTLAAFLGGYLAVLRCGIEAGVMDHLIS